MIKCYCIRDKKVGTHNNPIFASHLVEIQRGLIAVLGNEKSVIGQYPDEFELYELGTYDNKTAELKVHDKPLFLMTLSELQEGTPCPVEA